MFDRTFVLTWQGSWISLRLRFGGLISADFTACRLAGGESSREAMQRAVAGGITIVVCGVAQEDRVLSVASPGSLTVSSRWAWLGCEFALVKVTRRARLVVLEYSSRGPSGGNQVSWKSCRDSPCER